MSETNELDISTLRKERKKEVDNPPLYSKYIKDSKELVENASKLIKKYQTKELTPIKFRKQYMNTNLLGGLYPGNVIGIAGSSGHGKSTLLQELEDDIFNDELNPDNKDYILVRNNYEMSVFKLFLRELKKQTNKKIADILGEEFTEEEQEIADRVVEKESDDRIKYFETPQDPETWFSIMVSFCEAYKDKSHIVISIDHIALVKQTFAGKKDGIDNLIEYINVLRHLYHNVSFLILSQLNREIEARDNPRTSAPRKGDLYQSDFLFQISDVIIVVHNPYKLGLQEHMVIGQNQYKHLDAFKKDASKKTTNFVTKGNIFYHFIKLREDEGGTLQDVYIEKINTNKLKEGVNNVQDSYKQELPKYEPNVDLFEDPPSPFD